MPLDDTKKKISFLVCGFLPVKNNMIYVNLDEFNVRPYK